MVKCNTCSKDTLDFEQECETCLHLLCDDCWGDRICAKCNAKFAKYTGSSGTLLVWCAEAGPTQMYHTYDTTVHQTALLKMLGDKSINTEDVLAILLKDDESFEAIGKKLLKDDEFTFEHSLGSWTEVFQGEKHGQMYNVYMVGNGYRYPPAETQTH